jgi:hypothetical protein
MKCQVGEIVTWQNGDLAKWLVDAMVSWQNGKLMQW